MSQKFSDTFDDAEVKVADCFSTLNPDSQRLQLRIHISVKYFIVFLTKIIIIIRKITAKCE